MAKKSYGRTAGVPMVCAPGLEYVSLPFSVSMAAYPYLFKI